MKILLLSIMLLFGNVPSNDTQDVSETYVYICTGPSSKRYHSTKGCRGLKNCSAEIEKVTVKKAKELGRTPCKVCY